MASYSYFLAFIFIINVAERAPGDRGPPQTGWHSFIKTWAKKLHLNWIKYPNICPPFILCDFN
jgi:hypothetical protein